MIWYLIWNIKMANFNFLLYPRYRDTIGMDCDGNWYIPELEIVSLNWGYIPNFGDRPPKESNAEYLFCMLEDSVVWGSCVCVDVYTEYLLNSIPHSVNRSIKG